MIPSEAVGVPDGALTVETWMRAEDFGPRVGLATKTENSEFGLFVSAGQATFFVHLGGAYVEAKSQPGALHPGRWHHLAGVFDGAETRLYLDGKLQQAVPASGTRTRNEFPFIVGGDPNSRGEVGSFFHGSLDELRISRVARYSENAFVPQRRLDLDADCAVLLHFDGPRGPWIYNAAGQDHWLSLAGNAQVRAWMGF